MKAQPIGFDPGEFARHVHTTANRLLLIVLFALPQASHAQESTLPRACRSVHFWWQTEPGKTSEATAFYNELTVEKSTRGSYFMACGFGKGYFGIQELPNGKKLALFSIWEPGKQNNPNATPEERRVKEIAAGEGVRVRRFGGEGTGGQSFYDYDWKIGEFVRFVVFAKPDGPTRTQYAGYIYLSNESRWQHMATFSTIANGQLLRGYYSFVEDFLRNGESAKIVHRASFGNGWVRAKTQDGEKWLPLTKGRFTADNTRTLNVDAGVSGDRFFLQTGGDTKNENTKLRETTRLTQAERKPPLDLPIPFAGRKASANTVRVMAYNIKHGRGNDNRVDLSRAAAVIRRLNPDVVALQEIDNRVQRSGQLDEAKELAQLTGLKHHTFGSFFDYQGGEYGMAIISRYPLSDVTNLQLPDGAEPRTSLVATVAAPMPFRLASVHFYRTEEERLAQARALLEFLADDGEVPCIIAGDFNSRPDSPVLRLFSDWTIPDKGRDHFTFSSDKPTVEIDFIMFRPQRAFEVREIDVVQEPIASDHRPVTMDVESLSDDQLLELVQRQTFRYFYDFGHPDCGLARERSAPARRGEKGLTGLDDIVTTGGTGFGLMAFPIAVDRHWITREQAVTRLLKIVRFLERVPRFHGMWAHWYLGDTGEVRPFSKKDNGGDIVESAFLLQGLLSVRQYFDSDSADERELRQTITRLWHEADWKWYQNGKPWLYWHWSPDYGFEMNMPIMGFDECMIVYVLAVASPTHAVPPSLYDTGWAIGENNRFVGKGSYVQRLRIGPENCGGPLFFTHYSYLGLSPYFKDKYVTKAGYQDYADHHRAMNLYCVDWCRQNGYPDGCWGLTSSDDPEQGYKAHAAEDGPRGDNGTITPTAAISSIVYTPEESLACLRFLWNEHRDGLWSDFGFRDAFHLGRNWYAPAHLAIDQGPMIVMIENYRTGSPWKRFMSIAEIQRALELLSFETTKEH